MNSGNTFPSSTTAGDNTPPSSFLNPTSFSQPINHNNPNLNSTYNLDYSNSNYDHYLDPNLVDSNNNNNNNDPDPNFGPGKVMNKNPKKRTRASRRAPTTVLTTDTTNFRQMVQEFTGIPAVPFSSSSSGYSSRVDLYAGSVSGLAKQVSNCQPNFVASMQPVRPSAHKIIQLQQPPPSYLQMTPSETSTFTKQPLNLSNLQNQMFPFQSVSQNLGQQVNTLDASSGFTGSSSTNLKRWRGQDENLMNFEGPDGNYENVVVSSSDGEQHQLPSNEDSWSF